MEDYYKVLDVKQNSTPDEIKRAYRKLSLKKHPDKNNGDDRMFKQINEAYQTLGNPEKRRMYDMQKNNPLFRGMSDNMMASPEDFLNMMFGGMAVPFEFMGAGGGMPHVRVFHNGRPMHTSRIQKPSPIVKTISITLQQAYAGVNYPIEIERWAMDNGVKRMEKEKVYVDVKPGVDDNEIITLGGKGNILSDNNRGDVKLFIKIENGTDFKRNGLDLVYIKEITLKEALVGFTFDIKHVSGKTYTINNGEGKVITPNFAKTISNMGMRRVRPHPASPIVGNLIIAFKIKYPTSLTTEQQEKLKEIL